MKIIVGLGNPGRSYSRHRHNVGFMAIDVLGGRHGIEIAKRSFGSLVGSGSVAGEAVLLAKPLTYMNLSGDSVAPLLRYYRLEPDQLIVVHDDLDLEFGKLKLVRSAGHGGHNGVRSIIETIGSNDFFRVRVGIGRPSPEEDAAGYVLKSFDDEKAAKALVDRAADAAEAIISLGLSAAQQKFH